jgi:hypothetical protein
VSSELNRNTNLGVTKAAHRPAQEPAQNGLHSFVVPAPTIAHQVRTADHSAQVPRKLPCMTWYAETQNYECFYE